MINDNNLLNVDRINNFKYNYFKKDCLKHIIKFYLYFYIIR